MRVLVCGGRDFNDARIIRGTLNRLLAETQGFCLIHGGAPGADSIAQQWSVEASQPEMPFPADWKRWGRSAGPRRNQQMLDEGKPDLVVAFPGGRGTADMVRRAREAGVKVQEIAALTPASQQSGDEN